MLDSVKARQNQGGAEQRQRRKKERLGKGNTWQKQDSTKGKQGNSNAGRRLPRGITRHNQGINFW